MYAHTHIRPDILTYIINEKLPVLLKKIKISFLLEIEKGEMITSNYFCC